jgi:hypothetical protein
VALADQKEAKASLEEASKQHESSEHKALDSPNAQQVQNLTRLFVRAYLSSPIWRTTAEVRQREKIVEAAALRQNIIKTQTSSGELAAQNATDAQDFVSTVARDSVIDPNRPSELQERLDKRLTDDATTSPGAWKKLSTKFSNLADAYNEPAKPSEFVEVALGQILDPAFDAIQPQAPNEAVAQLEKIVSKGLKTSLDRSINIEFDRFLTSLMGESSVADALSRVAKVAPTDAGLTPKDNLAVQAFLQNLDQEVARVADGAVKTPPAFAVPDVVSGDINEIRRLAAKINADQAKAGGEIQPALDYLAGYEDYFPANKSKAESTLRAELLADEGFALTPQQLAASVERARSYERLTAFNRVGGVLIGRRDIGAGQGLDGLSLRLQATSDKRVNINLRDSAGHEHQFGPYSPDIVYRALIFAADGRPLVVTILNTGLGSIQKVILHPTLLNTILGCEMIELDSFVFSYIDEDTRKNNESEMHRVATYNDLYILTLYYAIHALVDEKDKAELEADIDAYKISVTEQRLQAALIDPLLFTDKARSPLAARNQIYNESILDSMQFCAPPHGKTLDEYGECIETQVLIRARSKITFTKAFQFVSGVRDRAFSIDPNMTFLQREDSAGSPLQFLIQVTDAEGNSNAWLFSNLTPSIEKSVADLVANNPTAREIFADAEDFTILQRLFRAIFDGKIRGDDLLNQIATLTAQLRVLIDDTAATARWKATEVLPGMDEARQIVAVYSNLASDPSTTKDARPEIKAALSTLAVCARTAAGTPDRLASATAWRANCSLASVSKQLDELCSAGVADERNSVACRLARLATFSDETLAKIELAEQIGVPAKPTAQPVAPRQCRPAQLNAKIQ